MTDIHTRNRRALDSLRAAQYNWDEAALRRALGRLVAPDAIFHLAYPFGDMVGPDAFHDRALAVLRAAWPDVERRDWIVMASNDEHGADWVGCGGHFMGTFAPRSRIFAQGLDEHHGTCRAQGSVAGSVGSGSGTGSPPRMSYDTFGSDSGSSEVCEDADVVSPPPRPMGGCP